MSNVAYYRYMLIKGHKDKICVGHWEIDTCASWISSTRHYPLSSPQYILQGLSNSASPPQQSWIHWQQQVLKMDLGLTNTLDNPHHFKTERRKVAAFFPDLVRPPAEAQGFMGPSLCPSERGKVFDGCHVVDCGGQCGWQGVWWVPWSPAEGLLVGWAL